MTTSIHNSPDIDVDTWGVDAAALDTPTLIVNEQVLEANLERAALSARRIGASLRPHAKTHKSIDLARRQIAHGATGLTVATIGEAEVFAAAGFDDLFIAYPLWATGLKARRLREVAEAVSLTVGADSPEGARTLARALGGTGARLLVEVDSGGGRTGVIAADRAEEVAAAAARLGLPTVGAFTHGGHSHSSPGDAEAIAQDEASALAVVADALRFAGHDTRVISVGSTPTAPYAVEGVTEVRPGTYVFNDRLQFTLGSCGAGEIALVVATTVVSRSWGRVAVDAGAKTLSKDLPPLLDGYGAVVGSPQLRITALYDHHGIIEGRDDDLPDVGDVLFIVPNHVCPVVDLARELHLVGGPRGFQRWAVSARSQNQ